MDKLISDGHRFIGIYERTFVTDLPGDNIVDAIKWFNSHYNSVLVSVFDAETKQIYKAVSNKKADARGRLNNSYYDEDKNLVYNEDEETRPIVKIQPSKIAKDSDHGYIDTLGNFYQCGFEAHKYLAKELFLTKTIKEPAEYSEWKAEIYLDTMKWVKISSHRIHHLGYLDGKEIKLTRPQKQKIIRYMDVLGYEKYEYQYDMNSKYDIEIELMS